MLDICKSVPGSDLHHHRPANILLHVQSMCTAGKEHEEKLNDMLAEEKIAFWTEENLRDEGAFKTPDAKLQVTHTCTHCILHACNVLSSCNACTHTWCNQNAHCRLHFCNVFLYIACIHTYTHASVKCCGSSFSAVFGMFLKLLCMAAECL